MKYEIVAPIVGELFAVIEADSKEKALDILHENWTDCLASGSVDEAGRIIELQALEIIEKINSGNVCHVDSAWELSIDESTE